MSKAKTFRVRVRTGQIHAIDIVARNDAAALRRAKKLWHAGRAERFDCIHHKTEEVFAIEDDTSAPPILPTNEHRARWAQDALAAYAAKDGCGIDAETFRDLVTDLGHWADRNGIAFEHEVIHAMLTWRREKAEEVQS